jgi:hypothetical protein
LDYVERVVRKQYPQYEGFIEDISGVLTAQKINIEQLQSDAKKYIDNINNVQSSLDSGNLSDPKRFHPEDRVSQVVQRSMKDARRKAEQMQLYLDEMRRVYNDILTFFGDDNKDENARREFFAKLANFLNEYKVSREGITSDTFGWQLTFDVEISREEPCSGRDMETQRGKHAPQAIEGGGLGRKHITLRHAPESIHGRDGLPPGKASCGCAPVSGHTRAQAASTLEGSSPSAGGFGSKDSRDWGEYGGGCQRSAQPSSNQRIGRIGGHGRHIRGRRHRGSCGIDVARSARGRRACGTQRRHDPRPATERRG